MVFAPDALFPLGGYPGDEDKARAEDPRRRHGQGGRRRVLLRRLDLQHPNIKCPLLNLKSQGASPLRRRA